MLVVRHQIWSVLVDLGEILDEDLTSFVDCLEADERLQIPVDGSSEDLVAINESGLYALLRNLQTPLAESFKEWFQTVAIPSLRSNYHSVRSVSEALNLAITVLERVGIGSESIGNWLLDRYIQLDPGNSQIYADARLLISQQKSWLTASNNCAEPIAFELHPTSEISTLIPKQIGQLLAQKYNLGYVPSAQKINQALVQLNWQISVNQGKDKVWKLTKAGQQYGRWESYLDNRGKKHCRIKWLPTVVEPLARQLDLL